MSNLPYDAEIEYIESSGTQYINTGIKLFESGGLTTLEFSMDVYVNTGQADHSCIVNAMKEVKPYPGVVIRTYGDNIQIARGNEDPTPIIGTCGTFQSITRTENVSFQHDIPTTIFAGLDGNNAPWRYCKLKLYRLSIRKDSILLFDAYPVRIEQTGYLYDKVSGELFGNAGTGNFILGNDKALPNPFGFRRRLMMAKGSGLPYDAEVEYLESTGTQWIDTGYKHNQKTRFLCDFEITAAVEWAQPFGSCGGTRGSNKLFVAELRYDTKLQTYYGALSPKVFNNVQTLGRHHFDLNKKVHKIDNQTQTFSASKFQSDYNVLIFGATGYNGSPANFVQGKCYYFQIYDNDVLVRDMIPVRVGQVGYMYDKVSGQLFGNSGTRNFILGNDVN